MTFRDVPQLFSFLPELVSSRTEIRSPHSKFGFYPAMKCACRNVEVRVQRVERVIFARRSIANGL